jgi:hypothetical protein
MHRPFLPVFVTWLSLLSGSSSCLGDVLPVGDAPLPVPAAHFPTPLHAVIWRNWFMVQPERIARAAGTDADKVRDIAEAMGLPREPEVSPQWKRRGYITIVRRNWHLVPYEQLLTLLDMSADELAFSLREDDGLYIKLGSHKPRCMPVRWVERTAEVRQREAEIRRVVAKYFPGPWWERREPPFAFVESLSRSSGNSNAPPAQSDALLHPRFIYSYFGTYGDPLIDETLDPYPDGLLEKLADSGANGVWLHVVLRSLAPGGPDFPEFGTGHETRLANLSKLVARAKRRGIRVYLYINEPRAMPRSFFEKRSDMAGVAEGDYLAMCTSDPRVRKWLGDSLAFVFHEVPDLGGVFTITASENLTSCASHGHQADCPRCKLRDPDDIIAEVNAAIEQGVHRGNPQAQVFVWDWGWHHHSDAATIIARLPKAVSLMSVSEWGLLIERGGVKTEVGEYSLSAVGPGPRALRHWKLAQDRGLATLAKVQLNNSWELSTVPSLPVLDLVAGHCENLAHEKVTGQMLSWSLGGYPSVNLRVAREFAEHPDARADDVLDRVAAEYYGPDYGPPMRRAWKGFSRAFSEYPFHIRGLYLGPQQLGPANLLWLTPTGNRATMTGFPFDDLASWRFPYPADVYAGQMQRVAKGFEEGCRLLTDADNALRQPRGEAPDARREEFLAHWTDDRRVAEAAWCHFASVANQACFVAARDQWLDARNAAGHDAARAQMLVLLDREIALSQDLLVAASRDSRIGFEASNQYFYVPGDLVEKVIDCEYLKERLATQTPVR